MLVRLLCRGTGLWDRATARNRNPQPAVHWGVLSLHWIPWALFEAGALTMVYTETPDGEKTKRTIEYSNRNKASLAAAALGCALLVFVMFHG